MSWKFEDPGRYSWKHRDRQGRSGGRRDQRKRGSSGCLVIVLAGTALSLGAGAAVCAYGALKWWMGG